MAITKRLLSASLLAVFAFGCDTPETKSALNDAGPPMVRQIRMDENITSSDGAVTTNPQVFAFGDHELATPTEKGHPVTTASPSTKIRVIMDELLVGNYLEQIECFDGSFSNVPLGATPDDIAACGESRDILAQTCKGEHAVCLGPDGPIGILDNEPAPVGDGAADRHRFIEGAVKIVCGDIIVPLNLSDSYWQPAGNQQKPADAGLGALGPAVFLATQDGLPTGKTCTIQFGDEVVDYQGVRPCAPPNGDVSKDCTPGDTSAIVFGVDKFRMLSSFPTDGQTDITSVAFTLQFSAKLKPSTAAAIVLKRGATVVPSMAMAAGSAVTLTVAAPLAANAQHTITIPTTVTDMFGTGQAAEQVITFTTGTPGTP